MQIVVARILNAIYEQDFLPNSFGYRPGVGPREAVQDITSALYWEKYSYIVDADIKRFFDSIDHEWLIKMLEQRIDDRAFIGLYMQMAEGWSTDTGGSGRASCDGNATGRYS